MPSAASYRDELFWSDDPKHFITGENFHIIIPQPGASLDAQLNAVMRFALYFSLVVLILRRDMRYSAIAVLAAGFTFGIHYYDTYTKRVEKMTMEQRGIIYDPRHKQECMRPTRNNPFMNVTYNDYRENAARPGACDVSRPGVKRTIERLYQSTSVYDADDIFKRNSSSRQFYTTPSTTIPNDQTSFAHWLYRVPGKTCKEDGVCQAPYRVLT